MKKKSYIPTDLQNFSTAIINTSEEPWVILSVIDIY